MCFENIMTQGILFVLAYVQVSKVSKVIETSTCRCIETADPDDNSYSELSMVLQLVYSTCWQASGQECTVSITFLRYRKCQLLQAPERRKGNTLTYERPRVDCNG